MANVLFSAMKNEAPFLLEWIAYHKAIGFDKIVIVTNDCVDATDDLLAALASQGEIVHVKQNLAEDQPAQEGAVERVSEMNILSDGDWGIFLDADEFLNIHIGGGSVADLVAFLVAQDQIGMLINWRVFGDAGHPVFLGRYISESYTRCDNGKEKTQFKTFFQKTSQTRGFSKYLHLCDLEPGVSGLHRFLTPKGSPIASELSALPRRQRTWLNRWVETGQSPLGSFEASTPGFAVAQINHYMVRDPHSFELKKARGRGYAKENSRHTQRFYNGWNRNDGADRSILKWESATTRQMDRLTQVCGLQSLNPKIKSDYLNAWEPSAKQRPSRYAKTVLQIIRENGLHGTDLAPPPGFQRGIDVIGEDALQDAIARSAKRYRRFHKRLPNLVCPKTFTEKQVLFKFFAPIPLNSPSDKLRSAGYLPRELRKHVKIPKRFWVSDRAGLPENDALPDGRYFFKSNHSSGTNLPLDWPISDAFRLKAGEASHDWLTKIHDENRSLWWYETMPRNTYLEEDLSLSDGDAPDWKFFVVNGRVELFQVDTNRQTDHIQTIYDRQGKFLDEPMYFRSGDPVPMPDCLPRMVEVAEGVGRNFDFIRVDMFLKDDRIYLGELTLVPNGATIRIQSSEIDERLGKAWNCPWVGQVVPDWQGSHYSNVKYEAWDEEHSVNCVALGP